MGHSLRTSRQHSNFGRMNNKGTASPPCSSTSQSEMMMILEGPSTGISEAHHTCLCIKVPGPGTAHKGHREQGGRAPRRSTRGTSSYNGLNNGGEDPSSPFINLHLLFNYHHHPNPHPRILKRHSSPHTPTTNHFTHIMDGAQLRELDREEIQALAKVRCCSTL